MVQFETNTRDTGYFIVVMVQFETNTGVRDNSLLLWFNSKQIPGSRITHYCYGSIQNKYQGHGITNVDCVVKEQTGGRERRGRKKRLFTVLI